MTPKYEKKPCVSMAKSRPFVVCSLDSKRYASRLAKVKKPVEKLPLESSLRPTKGRRVNVCMAETTENRMLTLPGAVASRHIGDSTSDVESSPPPSPDLSSFPSQTWTIVVGANTEKNPTPTTICGDGTTIPSVGGVPKSSVVGTPRDAWTTAKSRPFVVCSLTTKRYASRPVMVKKPAEKLPPGPSSRPAKVLPGAGTTQTSRSGPFQAIVRKPFPSRPTRKPMVQNSERLSFLPPAEPFLPVKTFVPKPLILVQRLKDGTLLGGPAYTRSTQVTIPNELPPRPSCIPRTRNYRSVGSVVTSCTIEVSASDTRSPGIAQQGPTLNVGMTNTYTTGNGKLTPPEPIANPYAVQPEWSPPPSPDLSSFPSQTWETVASVVIEAPTMNCGNAATIPSMDITSTSIVAGTDTESCEPSEPVFTSPASSSSATAVGTTTSPAERVVGSDGTVGINTPNKESSAEVSHTVCAATFISSSTNGTSSITTLANVMNSDQASSHPAVSDAGNRTPITIRSAFEIARAFFSLRQSGTRTTLSMATNGSQNRRLSVPSPAKDAKASKNPTTQMEIEVLRAQRKVTGDGVVGPRLYHLGSLTAMAAIMTHGMAGSESAVLTRS